MLAMPRYLAGVKEEKTKGWLLRQSRVCFVFKYLIAF